MVLSFIYNSSITLPSCTNYKFTNKCPINTSDLVNGLEPRDTWYLSINKMNRRVNTSIGFNYIIYKSYYKKSKLYMGEFFSKLF